MAITRRQFLGRTGLATAGALFGPTLFRSPWMQQAMAATIGDRYFIVLFLDGGNDGQNTVIPVSGGSTIGSGAKGLRALYEDARDDPGTAGGIRILNPLVPTPGPGAPALIDPNSGCQLGFHPGLASLRDMYEQGMVAVLQGCGYPEYNLSHEVSRGIWEHGNPLSTVGSGWMGRYLAAAGYLGGDIPAVNIGGSVSGEYQQTATSVLVFNRLQDFGFPYDDSFNDDDAAKDAAFNALCNAALANGNAPIEYIGSTGKSTLTATNAYPALHSQYQADRLAWSHLYNFDNPPGLNTSTARGFREIAKVIYGVARGALPSSLSARFFELANGGYDTHSSQGGEQTDGDHYRLHAEVSDAIKLFYEDLADMAAGAAVGSGLYDLPNKVTVLVWSEFSRRVRQNDSGTDHGSQGPMFVIGGANAINGGVYGNHPNIDPSDATNGIDDNGNSRYSQDNANPQRSTDFRDVYGTIMKQWLGIANPLPELPLDSDLGYSGPDYWTVANFNMGFMP
ncbi:MAG TPA: DUF1501 domain-containing protein [Candidatus Dormibacteraeota bacterium]|nr:DUF1501 domain-containing protein [Candidatus Dormibacteraeota bacterium]